MMPPRHPTGGTAREGMKSFDNFRFIRLLWEIPADSIGVGNKWTPFNKGGEFFGSVSQGLASATTEM